jgi:hypothetical protein
MRALRVTKGHMVKHMKPGAGAKPQPGPPRQPLQQIKFKYILNHIYNKNTVWALVGGLCKDFACGGEVTGSSPVDSINF